MKLKQLLISTASIAALAVVPMSIVSCGNNNNNAVEDSPSKPGNGGDGTQNPGNGGDGTQNPGNGGDGTQNPTINYINVENRNEMIEHILTNSYIVSDFIRQVFNRPFDGEVTYVKWTENLTSIAPGSVSYDTDENYHYYNVKNLTFTIKTNIVQGNPVALYYSVNGGDKRETVSANGSWTISVDLHFKSTKKIENV